MGGVDSTPHTSLFLLVLWNDKLCEAKKVENCLCTFCGDPQTVEVVLRTVISVNQLSIHGAVADMCEELASQISDCPASTEKPVAEDKPETMVSHTDLSTTTNPLLTNDRARGILLPEHKQRFANLPDDLRIIKVCSDADFMKTVTSRYRLMQSKRMDPWKHEDRSSIGGNYHQGRFGIEITIKSWLGDGSQSWVMLCTRLNKYVTQMSEEQQENRDDASGARTVKPAAKARPKPMSSSLRIKIPFNMREWIDVEPGEYDQHSFDVVKKMNRSLRHDFPDLRAEDGAVEFKIMAPMFVTQFESSPHWSIRTWKRFQYCLDPYSADTLL